MVSGPGVTPVTVPPVTVALALVLFHMPPVTASASVMLDPAHTVDGPVINPADGSDVLTSTARVAAADPHAFVTV